MKLSETCIRRPVFATVLSLVVVLIGMVSYQRLAVREYPNIDTPTVNVRTDYAGASAEIVETQVTQVLEESLAGIEGLDYITSVNRQGRSQITINFRLNRDSDAAAADVRDRVSRARGRLPEEIDEPVIQKVEADAQAILYLAFSSSRHSPLEISDYADRYVKDQLQTLPGVAEVRIFGERRYSMRLWIDPLRLAGYGLTVQDVEEALRRQNVEIPAGLVESADREFSVLSQSDLRTVDQFNDLVVKRSGDYLVRLEDVGYAQLAPEDDRRASRFNGNMSISMGVVKQATANPLDVSRAVREALPRVEASLPEGMRVDLSYDKSEFIEQSISNVFSTITEAIILVVLIIFFFLRSVRATLIPLVTIPVSLVGSFALMHLFGFSINTLTLLALILAIGLVVDDAIVMLENIYRNVEEGLPPVEAALKGSKELGFAIVAMTLTLAAVYVPIGFMTGKTGRLFTEFAWALAGAVLISGFVALTLSPMMSSKLLRRGHTSNRVSLAIEGFLDRLTAGYLALLAVALRLPALVLMIGFAVACAGGFAYSKLSSELAPYEDQGVILGMMVGPEGATKEYMDGYARDMEALYARIPEAERYFVIVGYPTVSRGISFLGLKPWDERDRSAKEIASQLRDEMFMIPGILAFPITPPPLGQRGSDKPVQLVIQTSQPYDELQKMVDGVLARLAENDGLTNVESDLKLNLPQIKVGLDRDKVADLGIEVDTVGRTLETLLGGRKVTRFKREGKQYEVILQLTRVDRSTPSDLRNIYVRSTGGEMVSLANIVSIEEAVAPLELNHFDQLRAATITANLADGYSLGDALAFVDAVAAEVLPGTAQTDYAGQSREFRDSGAEIYLTFVLALIFIYLVLAAQFESFIDPFIILLTVPLSIAGGLAALYWSGGTLNIYSQVGLVTLIGLISKHGILIVEFANQTRARGEPVREAVLESAGLRLRPILMTTGAMVLGAVPLALAAGAGAESRQDIGWVIVGGILVGTLFTLFVIPAAYTVIRGGARTGAPVAGVVEGLGQPAE